jgi:hypothetical protein
VVTDLESHFIGKQEKVKETFDALLKVIATLENVSINSLKNAILFTNKTHFLAVKPKKAWLDIEFVLDEKLEGFPIHKTVQASKKKWAHFMRLGASSEMDEQLVNWIKKAYEISN